MASRIPVLLSRQPYDVIVGSGILPRAGEFVRQVTAAKKCALITDTNVGLLYGETVRESLEKADLAVTLLTIPAGEESKCLAEVSRLSEVMIADGLDRSACVVALGGGVVGDLAGFVASVYYRGIPHVQIPTSVVAQVDSSIGGKTGVNAAAGKNLIGAFHQPAAVITDPETLDTLPKREFNEGLAEVIKHAAIRDPSLLDGLATAAANDLPTLISRNVKIKALIVAEDEFETLGLRALLNFGHTVGHAIENTAGYGRFLHGEAISIGLAVALDLSRKKAGLPEAAARRVLDALDNFQLPVTVPPDLSTDTLIAALRRDKKFSDGAIRFVLVPELGTAVVSSDVTEADLRAAIDDRRS
jgi:3-dehydroquinate synthase